ncbi:hypothetical protein O0L34_g8633 [Tuta absoluta]|nr:hypothetical protein O0L34_g8633 [Tuta absoluta]
MDENSILLDPSLDKQLKGHRDAITALSYSPNEQQLASSSLDNSILLWDLSGSLRSYRFRGHDEAVMDVTFSPSGKYMASASRDKTVRLWVPTVTGSTGMFKAHSQTVRSVQFSSDGNKLITASDDKIVKLWSSDKYKFISSFVGHTNWVRCARMTVDGSIIASCSDDKTTRLWNPDSGELIHTYKDQKGHGLYVAWHPSGCYIAVGTSQGNIKLYDTRTHSLVQYYSIHNDAVTQVAFHPSGSYILSASKDGKMKILDLLEGHPIFTLSGHTGSVNAVSFSPSGETFASAGEDKMVKLWRTNFTELANDVKENVQQTASSVPPKDASRAKLTATSRTQGTRQWYLCYHSNMYPKTNFVHLDENEESRGYSPVVGWDRVLETVDELPAPKSTFNTPYSPINRTMDTEINSSYFQRSFPSNSTSKGRIPDGPVDDECGPECRPFIVTQHSSCNRSHCTNPSCGLVIREPNDERNTDHSLQNQGNSSHEPRIDRDIRRSFGIRRESTPRPEFAQKSSYRENQTPRQSYGRSDNNNPNSRITPTPRTERPSYNVGHPSQHQTSGQSYGISDNNNPNSRITPTPRTEEHPSHNVGHPSHIPRSFAPKPSTFHVPSFMDRTQDKTVGNDNESPEEEDGLLFGLVKLNQNDVCYTSGTIEWVGRKRTFPVNSGFKILNENELSGNEPMQKKVKRLDKNDLDDSRECDCVEMLPTVNAIVDHLNALHQAVDLIDLRLNTVEDTVYKKD